MGLLSSEYSEPAGVVYFGGEFEQGVEENVVPLLVSVLLKRSLERLCGLKGEVSATSFRQSSFSIRLPGGFEPPLQCCCEPISLACRPQRDGDLESGVTSE